MDNQIFNILPIHELFNSELVFDYGDSSPKTELFNQEYKTSDYKSISPNTELFNQEDKTSDNIKGTNLELNQIQDDHEYQSLIKTKNLTITEEELLKRKIINHSNSYKLEYDIVQIPKTIEFNPTKGVFYYHAGRKLTITFKIEKATITIRRGSIYFLKLEIQRTNQKYSQYPVNKVCKKHITNTIKHPIQQFPNSDGCYFHLNSPSTGRYFLYYRLKNQPIDVAYETISIVLPCTRTCVNSTNKAVISYDGKSTKSNARNIKIICNLEEWRSDTIIQASNQIDIPIYSKTIITKLDLNKSTLNSLDNCCFHQIDLEQIIKILLFKKGKFTNQEKAHLIDIINTI